VRDSLFFTPEQNKPSQPNTQPNTQPNIQPNIQPIDKTTSRYQSNIIVQSSNDPIAVNAANALFNKHLSPFLPVISAVFSSGVSL
jgi:hypothetical protein